MKLKIISLISLPKQVLWVLKRTNVKNDNLDYNSHFKVRILFYNLDLKSDSDLILLTGKKKSNFADGFFRRRAVDEDHHPNGKKYKRSTQFGPRVLNLFSCSTQLSTKFQLLINTKTLTNEEVFCFKSLRCCLYHANTC